MYEVKVLSEFSAAHMLRHYKGKCENMHGHNWKVELSLKSEKLDEAGMVVDFKDLKKALNDVLEVLDHKNLNEIPYFSAEGGSASGGKKVNPTSENIAKYVYDQLNDRRLATGDRRLKVTVWESDRACATYGE